MTPELEKIRDELFPMQNHNPLKGDSLDLNEAKVFSNNVWNKAKRDGFNAAAKEITKIIQERINEEKEEYKEIKEHGGHNTCASGMALGAIDCCDYLLEKIGVK